VDDTGGGAIYNPSGGILTVLGCTFYQNQVGSANYAYGGAIFNNTGGTLTLTGNLFRENKHISNNGGYHTNGFHVIRSYGTFTTGGYNVSDYGSGATKTASGWVFEATSGQEDKTVTGVTFNGTFNPSLPSTGWTEITSLPDGFPSKYFDGSDRGTTPGAMPKQ
jgi:hypothetical protein